MSYLDPMQVDVLLRPLRPERVSKRDGNSYIQAYDVRRVLISTFGFARWSGEVIEATLAYEDVAERTGQGAPKQVVSVGYLVRYRLTICAPDGTVLATYTEAAAGDATNFPINKRGDAHDFAVKTAESQALKRCATNLGDFIGGLSLYNGGSLAPLVRYVLGPDPARIDDDGTVTRSTTDQAVPDDHITKPLPAETAETTDAEPGEGPVSVNSPPPAQTTPADAREGDRQADVERFRDLILAPAKGNRNLHYAKLTSVVAKAGLLTAVTADGNGEQVTLKRLIDQRMAEAAETSKARTPYKDDEEAAS